MAGGVETALAGEWIGLGMGMRMALGSLAFMTFSPTGSFTRRIVQELD